MNVVKRADIVFVQGKGFKSRIVRLFDKGTFSHVAIAISDSKVIEADAGTKVAVRPFNKDKYNIVEVIDLGLPISQRMEIYNTALSMIGVKYDYIQLFWYGLKKLFRLKGKNRLNNPRNVICSELVFIVLEKAGILDDLQITEEFRGIDLTPNELYDLMRYVSTNK